MIIELDGNKIGYIPKNDNEIIINLMEACKAIYGIIFKKNTCRRLFMFGNKSVFEGLLRNYIGFFIVAQLSQHL
jgi:hypothetical protein